MEQTDCFVGPDLTAPKVWALEQLNPATGLFDEYKLLIGFPSKAEALATYRAAFSEAGQVVEVKQRIGKIRELVAVDLSEWLAKWRYGEEPPRKTGDEFKETDHPRGGDPDNPGRFSAGSGSAASSPKGRAPEGLKVKLERDIPPELQEKSLRVAEVAQGVANKLGYDPKFIVIDGRSFEFELNGRKFHAAGMAFLGNDLISLFPQHLTAEQAAGTTAHEIMHHKFDKVLTAYEAESKAVMQDPDTLDGMRPDGTLKPPLDAKYPLYERWNQVYGSIPSEVFRNSDGVTDYSKEWWQAMRQGNATTVQAFHETLAEMAKVKYETGRLPEHYGTSTVTPKAPDKEGRVFSTIKHTSPGELNQGKLAWRNLYRAVEEIYKGLPK